ncbi:chromate transporter [Romboutsia lituseburensis]|uniref:Chromate transporter n=1 Tax=Romboutsia lituseburensis DSM 797 TaxID=1121325 RepID=A0A1G9RLV8_9FIRM|nr:chromate transporter [Romboutsia lituseburensis]CEH32760.1 Chromate transporter [Romboutsia lituseburensis]SDM24204.1 chromate transporter [Romboutsia lituseburensis DSM 797]
MLKLFLTFVKIGTFTFGGGYAMVPLIEDELVHKQNLLTQEEFIDYLSIAQSFPGVLAVNISVLLGYKLYKIPGVIVCTLGSILSAFVIVLAFSYFYFSNGSSKFLDGFFKGVSPVVIALLFYSFTNLLSKLDKTKKNILLLIISFIAIGIFKLSPIYLIIGGGIYSLCTK